MDETEALDMLETFLSKGKLLHITDTHTCGIPTDTHKPRDDAERETCEAHEFPITDHRHFVKDKVVALEGPDDDGYYKAKTENGSWRKGTAQALLKRLTEASLG